MKLSPTAIDLWYVDAADFNFRDLLLQIETWLSETEKQRLTRYQFEKHKLEFLLGRYLLRSVLSLYGELSPEDWLFDYNDYGKPFVASAIQNRLDMPLYFNLSHSRGKLVLAVANVESLGVDIEYGLKPRRIEKIAGRYFSSAEVRGLELLPAGERQRRFYDLWSLKEAYIKACGLGLAIPLADFSYSFSESGAISIAFAKSREDTPRHWQFWQLGSVPDFHIGLAVKTVDAQNLELSNLFQLQQMGEPSAKPLVINKATELR